MFGKHVITLTFSVGMAQFSFSKKYFLLFVPYFLSHGDSFFIAGKLASKNF